MAGDAITAVEICGDGRKLGAETCDDGTEVSSVA